MLVEVKKFGKEERVAVTSLDVAETFGKEHFHVMRDIRELGCSEKFRQSNFGLTSYEDAQGKKRDMYVMTRNGFTMLAMGYTGEKAFSFKEAYIQQFDQMEALLHGKQMEREKGIAVRQSLTKAIQQSSENERMHGHAYSTYTNAIYKALFGKNASQIKQERSISTSDNLRDALSAEELQAVQSMESLVNGLIGCGWGYDAIRDFIMKNNAQRQLIA